jgi:hypothetical protein
MSPLCDLWHFLNKAVAVVLAVFVGGWLIIESILLLLGRTTQRSHEAESELQAVGDDVDHEQWI